MYKEVLPWDIQGPGEELSGEVRGLHALVFRTDKVSPLSEGKRVSGFKERDTLFVKKERAAKDGRQEYLPPPCPRKSGVKMRKIGGRWRFQWEYEFVINMNPLRIFCICLPLPRNESTQLFLQSKK